MKVITGEIVIHTATANTKYNDNHQRGVGEGKNQSHKLVNISILKLNIFSS